MKRFAVFAVTATLAASTLHAESISAARQAELQRQVVAIRNEQSNHRGASWKISAIANFGLAGLLTSAAIHNAQVSR